MGAQRMGSQPQTLGIIAGSKSLPIELAKTAKTAGIGRIVTIAFKGETKKEMQGLSDSIHWLNVGQLEEMIRIFQYEGVSQCVMAGQIAPKNLFRLRPDKRARQLLMNLEKKNAHTIFGAIADELAKDGIELITAVPWLKTMMPGAGFRIGPEPSQQQQSDADYGFGIAKEVSKLEIGQTVVVKEGTVLAVEGFEGTDACLKRGGKLAGRSGGALAAKVAKKNHDLRFDIPCVGPQTIKTCARHGINTVVIEAERTLLLEREEMTALAERRGITLLTLA